MRSIFLWLLLAYIQQIICSGTSTKQYVFQFDLKNKHDWDEYSITQHDGHATKFHGAAHKCSPRMPQIFKKLCVAYNDREGYRLSLESADNVNVDPHFSDMLWFYGDHETAQNAQKIAKARYVDLDGASLTEITPIVSKTRRLLRNSQSSKLEQSARKCYTYGDAEACSHFHDSHPNLLTVSVGLKDDDAAAEADQYADMQHAYGDYGYYDELQEQDAYNEYDMDAMYDMYDMYEQYLLAQQLYNGQLANYLRDWNSMRQPQAQNAMSGDFGDSYGDYGYGDYGEYDMYYADSGENSAKENVAEQDADGDGAIANGFGISEASIMQRAEAEAKKNVELKMEKKLEGKLEAEMMKHFKNGAGGGGAGDQEGATEGYSPSVHKKHHPHNFEEGDGMMDGEDMKDKGGDDIDPEHSGMPMDELEEETDQNNMPPHDSLSAES